MRRPPPLPVWFVVALALAIVAVLLGGALFYRSQERTIQDAAESDLSAIAQLKARQVADWRSERLGDSALLSENPFFAAAVTAWLASPAPALGEQIVDTFGALKTHYGYTDVFLVDRQGIVRLGLGATAGELGESAQHASKLSLASNQPLLVDLHSSPAGLQPHLSAIAPIADPAVPDAEATGAVFLVSDAGQFLYPLIQTWPVPSASAESLLVRRDGDAVLFLNDLRHVQGTALSLHIPLTETDVVAVMAVQGRRGVVRGRDYRGTPVLAAIEPVAGSDWFLIAKVDESEVFQQWRGRGALIVVLTLLLLVALGAASAALWQRNATDHFRSLALAQSALQHSESRNRTTLMSVGDAVITTDVQGRVDLMNPVAERLTGWNQSEASRRPLGDVFRIVNEETGQPVPSPAERVLAEGAVVGLANHTLLIARDGTRLPIADSGAPISSEGGPVSGVVLVFRDQSKERAIQHSLEQSETKFRQLFANATDAIALHEIILDAHGVPVDYRFLEANAAFETHTGLRVADVLGRRVTEVLPGIEDTPLIQIYGRVALKGEPVRFEQHFLPLDRHYSISAYRVGKGRFATAFQDVTERKRLNDELAQANAELELRVQQRTAQLEASSAELEAFAYSVSHDLRAPLRSVDGFTRIVMEEYGAKLDAEGHRLLNVVLANTRRMDQLITDLLEVSRSSRVELRHAPIDMKALVGAVWSEVSESYPGEPLEFELDPLPPALGDLSTLRQVWQNLLSNAVKYTRPQTSRRIQVGGRVEGEDAIYFVRDSGVGFDPAYGHKLFRPFQRLHRADEFEGSGIGLAIVQRIVQRHGGRVWAESSVGNGATFFFALPCPHQE